MSDLPQSNSMRRADILDAARRAVTADRAATHGKPEDTFGLIAAIWSARLARTVSPAQVAIMLIDLKTARAWSNLAHGDNWVDIAGYAACGGELATATAKAAAVFAEFSPVLESMTAHADDLKAEVDNLLGEVIVQDNAKPEAPAQSPAPEKRHRLSKWTPEMDTALIAGIASRVANGMSRTAASHATAKEMGLGEKAAEIRAARDLIVRVKEAIDLAKAAKDTAGNSANTLAPAPKPPEPKPAPKVAVSPPPLSKRLSTPPHVALNIDAHLAQTRSEGWGYDEDLRLFELVVENGFGMGDVAVDMGRDSREIKLRYDLLTGNYRDANDKWCRKYSRDDVLSALRKAAV